MTIAGRIGCGLALLPWLAPAARAECFSGCGYGTLIAIMVLGGLAVLALFIFVMVKLGIGWLIKWVIAAAVLAVAVPPAGILLWHEHKTRAFEELDHAGPLPRLADKTPLFIIGSDLFNCPRPVERYIRALAGKGVLVVATRLIEGIDFSQPVALADLPITLHVGGRTGRDPDAENPYKGYSYHVRTLQPDQRQAAAASVDYVVFAQCRQRREVFEEFEGHPDLQDATAPFEVELAMAPLEKGSGILSIRALTFDLLDLRYMGWTGGFLFASARVGGSNTLPYDLSVLEAALCSRRDGSIVSGCAP